jgi:hypothetical protein
VGWVGERLGGGLGERLGGVGLGEGWGGESGRRVEGGGGVGARDGGGQLEVGHNLRADPVRKNRFPTTISSLSTS